MCGPVKVIIVDTGAPEGESGVSFVGGDPDPRDRNGHAAAVAALVRERAPGARLAFYKAVPESGHGSPCDLANALFAAAAEEPDIVNVSLAVPRGDPRLRRAVKTLRAAGALIVCGAGNDPAKGIQWPARYQETISVGALGSDGKPAKFSPGGCDLMLPGERVPVRIRGHGTAPISGTSIACAVASGLLASAMASGARDALEEIRNYSQQQERNEMSLKSKIKTKLEKLIDKWLEKLFGDLGDLSGIEDDTNPPAAGNPLGEGGGSGPSAGKNTDAGDSLDFALLDWRWGGFKGGGAALTDSARIKDLKVTRNGLSYSWLRGGCEDMGASGPHDADCLACMFCRVGGRWQGGKFDWISSDRHTRGFENIYGGYNGWDSSAISKADAFAFVIVSRSGRARTNVIVQEGGAK